MLRIAFNDDPQDILSICCLMKKHAAFSTNRSAGVDQIKNSCNQEQNRSLNNHTRNLSSYIAKLCTWGHVQSHNTTHQRTKSADKLPSSHSANYHPQTSLPEEREIGSQQSNDC